MGAIPAGKEITIDSSAVEKRINDHREILKMISNNTSQNTNGIRAIMSNVSEILNITKKQSQEIVKLRAVVTELKAIISGLETGPSTAIKTVQAPIPSSSLSSADLEYRKDLKAYYNRSIKQKKYTHLSIWEMDDDDKNSAFFGKFPGITITENIQQVLKLPSDLRIEDFNQSD